VFYRLPTILKAYSQSIPAGQAPGDGIVSRPSTAVGRNYEDVSEQLVKTRNLARLQQEAPALRNQLNDSLRQTQTVFRGIEPNNILDPSVLPMLETIQGVLPSQLDSLTTLASIGDWEALRQRVKQPLDVLSSLSAELVDQQSAEFRHWWTCHEVAWSLDWSKELVHPVAGNLSLNSIQLDIHRPTNLKLVAYMPSPGSDTADRLCALAAAR
jgi:hypothetical protein